MDRSIAFVLLVLVSAAVYFTLFPSIVNHFVKHPVTRIGGHLAGIALLCAIGVYAINSFTRDHEIMVRETATCSEEPRWKIPFFGKECVKDTKTWSLSIRKK